MMRRSLLLLCLLLLAASCASARRSGPVNRADVQRGENRGPSLHHYPGEGERVLIVGSPGISWRIFDVPGFGGLAPWLQNRGFDVWVLDWRDLPLTADLDAATDWVAAVMDQLGSERELMVVAHGLGGVNVIRAGRRDEVVRYVFLAVPGDLQYPLDPVMDFARQDWNAPHRLSEARNYKARPAAERRLLDALLFSYGTDPVSPAWLERQLTPVGPALLNDLAEALRRARWDERFEQGLASLTAPVTVLVGQTDAVAPPWQTYETYRKAGSQTRFYRFFSRALGDDREYGHVSLVVGKDAVRDVFPFVEEGLELEE